MRGRRDEISDVFKERAFKVLSIFVNNKDSKNLMNLKDDFYDSLMENLWNEGVNNKYDREMVIKIIKFINNKVKRNFNIVNYTIKKIENKELHKVYSELIDIKHIGHKISSFYLRDLVCVFDDYKFSKEEQVYLQPIDNWVGEVLTRLNFFQELAITKKADNLNERELFLLRGKIVDRCWEAGVSPVEFNQGAWYIGKNAFEILINNIDRF